MNKNGKFMLAVASLSAAAAVGIGVFLKVSRKDQKLAKDIGRDFYEAFYYDNQTLGLDEEALHDKMEKLAESGIHFTLDILKNFADLSETSKEKLRKLETESMWILEDKLIEIVPLEPYSVKDYHIRLFDTAL